MKFLHQLALGLALALSLSFSNAAFAIVGKFQFVNGEVTVINAQGQQRVVKKGDSIDEGDTVASASNGFAQIKMEDGGFFAVRPNTKFKVDTFKYNGKDDGSEKGLFSLLKGSLRSVTGVIGKKHHDNYKIQTASSTIGIRGSGADVGYDESVGTAVRTLFGGHTLTSNGQTVETGPGEVALAPPGETPKIVPDFPFNTDNGGGQPEGKSAQAVDTQSGAEDIKKPEKPEELAIEDDDVVIPVITTDGTNLTENEDSAGGSLTGTTLPAGKYIHHVSTIVLQGLGYLHAEHNSDDFSDDASNVKFNGSGGLISIADTKFGVDDAASQFFQLSDSSMTVNGGTATDLYETPDGSVHIGRIHGGSITNCTPTCQTDNIVDAHWIVANVGAPELVQSLTGATSYILAGATHPTDAAGNVGTLNSASLNANFTNQTMGFALGLSIAGNTFTASAAGVSIVNSGFSAKGGGLVTCSGPCAQGAYSGQVGGGFFGNVAATAALGYDFWPTSNVSGNYTDYITGLVAFTAGIAPTVPTITPDSLDSGMAFTALFSAGDPAAALNPLNKFHENNNGHFSSSSDASGNVVAFAKDGSGGGTELSFGLGGGSLVNTGSDALGVNWGRWTGAYIANSHTNGTTYSNTPLGSLHFISANHITTTAELGALSGLGIAANYSYIGGTQPTDGLGTSIGGTLTASAVVNFTGTPSITNYSVGGTGGTMGTWSGSFSGSAPITATFMSTGIPLTGSCVGGGGCASDTWIAGSKATGGFVGTQAQGLISTFNLIGSAAKINGAVYMRR
ncbi:MAG: FecR domain-containing protein [Methylophilaceae bacterium]